MLYLPRLTLSTDTKLRDTTEWGRGDHSRKQEAGRSRIATIARSRSSGIGGDDREDSLACEGGRPIHALIPGTVHWYFAVDTFGAENSNEGVPSAKPRNARNAERSFGMSRVSVYMA